tara:strand:+ start:2186 stop:2479 length:294 start_codon:yes stop_codon:yes gene_type:complete
MIELAKAVLLYASIITAPAAIIHVPHFPNDEGMHKDHYAVVEEAPRQETMNVLTKVKNGFFVPSANPSNPNEAKQGILILDASQSTVPREIQTQEQK